MDLSIPLTLSEEFNYTLNLLERTRTSAFITGRAGTGKSTLLSFFWRLMYRLIKQIYEISFFIRDNSFP